MNSLEQAPSFEQYEPPINMFDLEGVFDIAAAYAGAISDVATNEELKLNEKIQRIEAIALDASSQFHQDFMTFRSVAGVIAAEVAMQCTHNHSLQQEVQDNDLLSDFMGEHKPKDGHNHAKDEDDDDEIDPKTGKKKKRCK